MIYLDTSVLIDAFTGQQRSSLELRQLLAGPDPVVICGIVLFEWLRGPRSQEELSAQDTLFPSADAVSFTFAEARIAAARHSKAAGEAVLVIAACAIGNGASLWTLNPDDFKDIPGLVLWSPP